MAKTFFYIRKSTEEKNRQKYSLQYQKDSLLKQFENFFKEENEVIKASESGVKPLVLKNNKIISGRKNFGEMVLKIIKLLKNDIKVNLVAFEFSRLARNEKDFMLLYDLRKKGLNIYTSINTFLALKNEWDDPHYMIWSVSVMMSRQETILTKSRQYRGNQKARELGRWCSRPQIGYLKGIDAGILRIDEKKAKGIKELFLKFLNEDLSIKNFSKKYYDYFLEKYNIKIPRSSLQKILRSKLYVGLITYKNIDYKTAFKPILIKKNEKEIFEKVQKKLDEKRINRKIKHFFIFRGKIKCKCGYNLTPEKHKNYIYYRCQRTDCNFKTIREKKVLEIFKEFLENYKEKNIKNEKLKKFLMKNFKKIKNIKDEKNGIIENKIKKLENQESKLINLRLENLINNEEFAKTKSLLKNKKYKLQQNFKKDEKILFFKDLINFLEHLTKALNKPKILENNNISFLLDFLVSKMEINTKEALNLEVYDFFCIDKMLKFFNGGR